MNTFASNEAFIIAAYSITWLVILGYLGRLITKGSRTRTDYESMTRKNIGEGRP